MRRWADGGKAEQKADGPKPDQFAPPRRMRVPEAAAFLGVAPRTLEDSRWRKRHQIPFIRIGRVILFDARALERYLRLHRDRLSYAMLEHTSVAIPEVKFS